MDHPKTPEFSFDFQPYDFNPDLAVSPTRPIFDTSSAYGSGFETSPRLGSFSALAFSTTHDPSPSSPFPTHSLHNPSSSWPGETIVPVGDIHRSGASSPRSNTNVGYSSSGSMQSSTYSNKANRSVRYNPISGLRPARPTCKTARRGISRDDDLSDDDDDVPVEEPLDIPDSDRVPSADVVQRRREEIRRQRIESEQRRRDELRDGYAKLKYALPISNQKCSKVNLLDRAVTHIRQLETSQRNLQTRSDALEARFSCAESELTRLRNVNEQLMRNLADQHRVVTLSALAAAAAATNAQPSSSAGMSHATNELSVSTMPQQTNSQNASF